MPAQQLTPAVFLDRDGTLIDERGYLGDPERIKFYPTVFRALRRLMSHGFKLIVVTNQAGVGRGYFTLEDLKRVNSAFRRRLTDRGVRLAGLYFCPHAPAMGCACRKPKTGMIKKAVRELKIDLKKSYMVGDNAKDLELARNAGLKGVLVRSGFGRMVSNRAKKLALKVTRNMETASLWICKTA